MLDTAALARRLAEASDTTSAAEWLAEQVARAVPGAAVRLHLLGPGDRCTACPWARECATRDRCLHLAAEHGAFEVPSGAVERMPRTLPPFAAALGGDAPPPGPVPRALRAPGGGPGTATLRLLAAAGAPVGILSVRTPAPPEPALAEALAIAAHLSAATFEALARREDEARRRTQIALLSDLGRKVNGILDADVLLRQAVEDVRRTFGFHNVMAFTLDAARARLVLRGRASEVPATRPVPEDLPAAQGIVGRAAREGRTVDVPDVAADPDFVGWFAETRSEIAVPITVEGVVEGVLNVESDRPAAFGPAERLVLETVANQLGVALANARLFAKLRGSEEQYRTLVEASPAAVIHLDLDGVVVYANAALSAVTGRGRAEVLAGRRRLPDLAAPDERERLATAVAEALAGRPQADLEFALERPDGARRWMSASLQPVREDDGRVRGVVVLARDLTEDRAMQDRLRQSEKLSSIGTLVSGVAHELNNPLSGILGYAQLLLQREPATWSRADVEKIEKNARRCQRIVESLLAFSRQSPMTKRIANLNEVIQSVVRLNEYGFRMDDVEIRTSYDPRVPPLHLDVSRWQQVFVNLATNARDAMVAARSAQRILRIETRLVDDAVVVRVEDTGPGIPEGLRARVFEPFFTTKEGGTGLGLGICWGIVREHGGEIALEPPGAGGAAFRITLPVRSPAVAPVEDVVPAGPTAGDAGAGRRVLVVDDDAAVREVVVRALEAHRYAVDVAPDGESALAHVRAAPYDVVLTDLRMPGRMDGLAFHERLREEMPAVAARVVVLTGNGHDEADMARLEALRVRCVRKPFDIHHLARVVHEVAGVEEAPPAPGGRASGARSAP